MPTTSRPHCSGITIMAWALPGSMCMRALPDCISSAMPRKQRCTCPPVPTRSPYCFRIATWIRQPMGRSLAACCIRSKIARWSFSAHLQWSMGPSGRTYRSKRGSTGSACSTGRTHASTALCCSMKAGTLSMSRSGRSVPMAACSGSRLTSRGMDLFSHQRSVQISSSTFALCGGSG